MTDKLTFAEKLEKFSQNCFPQEIEWKVQAISKDKPSALVVPYLRESACVARLDKNFGICGWQDNLQRGGGESGKGGFVCGISLINDDGVWLKREDAGGDSQLQTNPGSEANSYKGGASDAFKRASKKWGFGRDLNKYPKAYIETNKIGERYPKITDNQLEELNGLATAMRNGEKVKEFYKFNM